MPCFRCGARQVDPDRGASPWKRGVSSGRQVLICPGCQSGRDWASDLDRCVTCGGMRLIRRLGDVECRDCGQVRESESSTPASADPPDLGHPAPDPAPGLAEEVARALERVLRGNRALQ